MNAQTVMSPWMEAAAWCSENPAAEIAAVCKAFEINAKGRDCSMNNDVVPFLLASAKALNLTRLDGSPYTFDRNLIPPLARHLEWKHGCVFTKRVSRRDAGQYTQATPRVEKVTA